MSDALAKARHYAYKGEPAEVLTRAEAKQLADRFTMLSIAESLSRLANRLAPDNPPMKVTEQEEPMP